MREILWITEKQNKNKNKTQMFYYLTIFCVVFGNSVGIAFFTQSYQSVVACKNPIVLLSIYCFVGLSCLLLILVSIELMSSVSNKFNTIPHWLRNFGARWVGSVSAIFYSFIYMPIIICVLSLMSWGFFFDTIEIMIGNSNWLSTTIKGLLIFILSLASTITLILFNCYSTKLKDWVIIGLNLLKFLPILIIVLTASYIFIKGSQWGGLYNTRFVNNNNVFVMLFNTSGTGVDVWSLHYFVLGMPLVMLSFDGFLHGVSVSNDKEYSKIVSGSSFIAVIIIIILNILMMGMLLGVTANADVYTLLSGQLGNVFSSLVMMCICFCILGSMIGFGSFGSNNYYTSTDSNVDGGQLICTRSGWQLSYESSTWRQLFVYVVYMFVISGLSFFLFKRFISYNQDIPIESYLIGNAIYQVALDMSSIIAVFSFLFYTNLIFVLVINRFRKKVEVKRIIGIGVLGIIVTPVLWFFCLYILGIDLYNINYLWSYSGSILNNQEVLSKVVTSALSYLFIAVWISIFIFNEIRIKKVMMNKIFSNRY